MRPTYETSVIQQHGTVVASGGTTVATGIDFAPTYEPTAKIALNVAAGAAGAVVCTVEQGTALASGYTTVGTISPGSIAGVYTLDIDTTLRYLRSSLTATGGTAGVTVNVLGKLRSVV